MTSLLGEGWEYLSEIPSLSLASGDLALNAGDSVQLNAQAKGELQGKLQWSIAADGETQVAKLDKTETAVDEAVTLTAQAAGKATLTVTAQAVCEDRVLTLSDSVRVYVSDENTVTVPDEF